MNIETNTHQDFKKFWERIASKRLTPYNSIRIQALNTCGLRNSPPSRVTVEEFKKEHEFAGPQFLDGILADGFLRVEGNCVLVTEKGEEVFRQYQKAVQERDADRCLTTERTAP